MAVVCLCCHNAVTIERHTDCKACSGCEFCASEWWQEQRDKVLRAAAKTYSELGI